MNWNYEKKSEEQLRKWFSNKKSRNPEVIGFKSVDDFLEWYNSEKKVCYYCGLTEENSQEIVHKGLLTSNRFPIGGVFSQGVNRGYWLEIDRKKPKGQYSFENCVLSCYFCNNDKSDVFTDEQYNLFMKDRVGYLRNLLKS